MRDHVSAGLGEREPDVVAAVLGHAGTREGPVEGPPRITDQSGIARQFQRELQAHLLLRHIFLLRRVHGVPTTRGPKTVGPVRGHRAGLDGTDLLDYETARRRIYLPAYRFVLDHHLGTELTQLRALAAAGPIALLDYTTNGDVSDLTRPLSHAALIRLHVLNEWPTG
ncbi:hypothetical protein ABT297_42430 [Dactylosporangium sp. NPDC000555]|uniref:DUF6939 family protein n=1 Tax=Dactylosporangium sp. NPDC000555 TaxID=3154260 RepID=UPI0033192593